MKVYRLSMEGTGESAPGCKLQSFEGLRPLISSYSEELTMPTPQTVWHDLP